MRLREVFDNPVAEAGGKQVSFALGRLNPATKGHGLLVEALKQGPGDSILFLTDRIAKLPSDPLQAQEKLEWAKLSFPDINIELAKNIMFAAVELYRRGYTDVTFFEGEDKLGNLLEKYNGVDSAHGMYKFDSINFKRLTRNPDADDASGMSASKLRQYVLDDNFAKFEAGVTKAAQPYAKKMFEKLKGILGNNESLDESVAKVEFDNGEIRRIRTYGKTSNKQIVDYYKNKGLVVKSIDGNTNLESLDENLLSVGAMSFKIAKLLYNNKWLITFSVAAWKGISWIADAVERVQKFLDLPIVKGLLKYGMPAVGVAMALYGGKKLYDQLVDAEGDKDKMKDVVKNFKPDEKHINDLESEFEAELKAA